ncbi:MAG: amidohydrolase family protein [Thermoplasmatales archaeon]|nr:amidohydrolase family protein [Candidatus Thermoplasmatota archaeon]MCL6003475.1 amidohydrolase family protein [Candidatus Thermoplasmatota archaeon]MDA8055742.1 amidohydrolase family protein [Thermoplasmatales archaeon]
MQILLKGGILLTEDHSPKRMDLFIDGNQISQIAEKIRVESEYVVNCENKIVSPGFVNMHNHVSMTNMRTLLDDMQFSKFLEAGFKLDAVRTDEDVYYGSKLGIAEMLRKGTTTFLDMYYGEDMVAKAAKEAGIRSYLGWSIVNKNQTTQKGEPLKNAEEFIKKFRGDELVTPLPAPHGIYSCDRDDLMASKEIADRYDLPYTIHLSENRREVYDVVKKEKKRPVEYLEGLGFLSNRLIAAHAIYVTLNEIKIMGRIGMTVVNNPVSNMKLANGNFVPAIEMIQHGINFTLGTDSAATGNSMDMLENAKLASLLQKNYREEGAVFPPSQVLDFMTKNPWKVLGKNSGILREGALADVTIVGGGVGQIPLRKDNAERILIYSSNGNDVEHTIVNGKLLYSQGKYQGMDLDDLRMKNEKIFDRYNSLMNS